MAYKDILVYLDPTPACEARLGAAVALARSHGARLWGVDVSSDEAFLGEWSSVALRLGARFETALAESGVEGRYVGSGDRIAASPPEHSHCVDLIVAGRPDDETRALVKSFVPDDALLHSGAPRLLIPHTWTPGPTMSSTGVPKKTIRSTSSRE